MFRQFFFWFFALGLIGFTACSNSETTEQEVLMKKEVKEYFTDSIPKIVWEFPENDSSEIKVSHYYHNRKLKMQGYIKNGVRNGKWLAWDEEGNMLSLGHYIDGYENGMWTVWFPSGTKRYEGLFKEGKRSGTWKFWDADGNLAKEIKY